MESSDCDLCGARHFLQVPVSITGEPPVVICNDCGLIYTNPRFSKEEVEAFDVSEFNADPGAAGFSDSNETYVEQAEFAEAPLQLRTTILPFLKRYVRPQRTKWLELRFRTGAIFQILEELGADIWGTDIFDANVRAAKLRFQRETFLRPQSSIFCAQ